jgi:hypothetical protein
VIGSGRSDETVESAGNGADRLYHPGGTGDHDCNVQITAAGILAAGDATEREHATPWDSLRHQCDYFIAVCGSEAWIATTEGVLEPSFSTAVRTAKKGCTVARLQRLAI